MWNQLLSSYTLQIVLLGTVLLGIISGIVGVFLTLKKEALVSDAISHATLPGVVLAYIISSQVNIYFSILGAIGAAFAGIFIYELIRKYTKVKSDAVLAIILSSFFGLGQMLLVLISGTAGQNQARLKKFVFGQAATMSSGDITFFIVILLVVLHAIIIFFRHFKLFIFNSEFYASLGFSKTFISLILNVLTVLVIVAGIQSVGVILMSALLIAPAVSARLWSDRLHMNLILSGFIGGISGALGTLFGTSMATGPVIVIFASIFVVISLLFAPKKGIVIVKIKNRNFKKKIIKYHGLIHMYEENNLDELDTDEISHFIESGHLIQNGNNYALTSKGIEVVQTIILGK